MTDWTQSHFTPFLVNAAWQSCVLVVAIFLLTRLVRHRSALVHQLLWTLALFGVLAIPLVGAGLNRVNNGGPFLLEAAPLATTPATRPSPMTRAVQAATALPAPSPRLSAPAVDDHDAADAPVPPVIKEQERRPSADAVVRPTAILQRLWEATVEHWRLFVGLAWAVGVCLAGVRLLAHWLSLAHILKASTAETHPSIVGGLGALARQMGVRRPVDIRRSAAVRVPCVCGMRRPAILLPLGLADSLDAPELRAVLAHELAHVRRSDYVLGCCQHLIQAVYWFHPLVHFAAHQASRACERVCDNWVLRVTGEQMAYARGLTKLAEAAISLPCPQPALPLYHRRDDLLRRIESILDTGVLPRIRLSWRGWCALGVLGVCLTGAAAATRVFGHRAPDDEAKTLYMTRAIYHPREAESADTITGKFRMRQDAEASGGRYLAAHGGNIDNVGDPAVDAEEGNRSKHMSTDTVSETTIVGPSWEWRRKPEEEWPWGLRWVFSLDQRFACASTTDRERKQSLLVAIDLVQKQILWEKTMPEVFDSFPQMGGNTVCVTSSRENADQPGDVMLFGYDLESANLLFKRTFPRENPEAMVQLSWLYVSDERREVTSPERERPLLLTVVRPHTFEIHKLNPESGATLWQHTVPRGITMEALGSKWSANVQIQPLLVSGQEGETLLLIRGPKKPYLLDFTDGSVVWEMDEYDRRQPVFVSEGQLIRVSPDSNRVTSMAPNGTKIWDYQVKSPIKPVSVLHSPLYLPKNRCLILQLEGGKLLALNTSQGLLGSGRVKWEMELNDTGDINGLWYRKPKYDESLWLAVVSQKVETLYAASETGIIYVLDVQSGRILRQTKTDMEDIRLNVLAVAVIGTSSDAIFRLDPISAKIVWQVHDATAQKRYAHNFYVVEGRLMVRTANRIRAYNLQSGELLGNYQPQEIELHSVVQPENLDGLIVSADDRITQLSLREHPETVLIQEKQRLLQLSQSATQLGNYAEAEDYLNEIVGTLDPSSTSTHWSLANLYQKSGQKAQEIRALVDYYSLFDPTDAEALAAVGRLKQLGGLRWVYDKPIRGAFILGEERLFSGYFHRGDEIELSAINRHTGEPVWKRIFYKRQAFLLWLQQDHENLFVLTVDMAYDQNYLLTSIRKSTGETNWEKKVLAYRNGGFWPLERPKWHQGGLLFLMFRKGQPPLVQVVDASTGDIVWTKPFNLPSVDVRDGAFGLSDIGRLVFQQNTFAVSDKDTIRFYDARSGDVVWTYQTEGSVSVAALYQQEDRLIFTTETDEYVCLDLDSRQRLWRFKSPLSAPDSSYSAKISYALGDTLVDYSETDRRFAAFIADSASPDQVRILWSTQLDTDIRRIFADRDAIFAATQDNTLLRIHTRTGAIEKEYPLLWEPWRVKFDDGTAYISSSGPAPSIHAMKLE